MTLLQALGATVIVEDADSSWGILKCRIDEMEGEHPYPNYEPTLTFVG